MRHTFAGRAEPLVLLYLFWEPMDACEISEFRDHRAEVEDFAGSVADSAIRFVARSYPAWWAKWDAALQTGRTKGHLEALEERYALNILSA